jgi:energy-coupling factor transporter ATP-binding protein EcfA2
VTAKDSIDAGRLKLMLNELRLPTIKDVWPDFAARSDKEGWPAARFLAALVENELAERARRRIARHLEEARLPPGKTLDTFDLIAALAAGDTWLDKGANVLIFGLPGGGKTHLAAALGLMLVENGWRVLFTRTTDLVQKLQVARRELTLEGAIEKLDKVSPRHPRRPRLRHQGPGRDQRPLRAHLSPLRTPIAPHHRQPALRRMGQNLPGRGHDPGRRRPPRPPRHHLRDERRKLSPQNRLRQSARARPSANSRYPQHRLIVAPRQSEIRQHLPSIQLRDSINSLRPRILILIVAPSHPDCRAIAVARDDRPWRGTDPPAIAYSYAPGLGAVHGLKLLDQYRGIVQCDGYAAYKAIAAAPGEAITLAFCWAHLRRKFFDIAKGSNAPIASEALVRIAELYAIEKTIRGISAEERRNVRQTRASRWSRRSRTGSSNSSPVCPRRR